VLATLVSVLSYNFFFVPPVFHVHGQRSGVLNHVRGAGCNRLLIGNLMASVHASRAARGGGHRGMYERTALCSAMCRPLAAPASWHTRHQVADQQAD